MIDLQKNQLLLSTLRRIFFSAILYLNEILISQMAVRFSAFIAIAATAVDL